jgi:hypothetical protein
MATADSNSPTNAMARKIQTSPGPRHARAAAPVRAPP